jgi:stage II sporulation protein D
VRVKHDPRGKAELFTFQGAGWGHGVGLCQIGAAVMASRGFSAEEILKHYFRGTEIRKSY